jgi:hypothetical protein
MNQSMVKVRWAQMVVPDVGHGLHRTCCLRDKWTLSRVGYLDGCRSKEKRPFEPAASTETGGGRHGAAIRAAGNDGQPRDGGDIWGGYGTAPMSEGLSPSGALS